MLVHQRVHQSKGSKIERPDVHQQYSITWEDIVVFGSSQPQLFHLASVCELPTSIHWESIEITI